MVCCHGSMNALAEEAVVARRYEGRDEFALAGRERIRSAEKNVGELVEGLGGLRPEYHQSANAGQILRQFYVGHRVSSPFTSWEWGKNRTPDDAPQFGAGEENGLSRDVAQTSVCWVETSLGAADMSVCATSRHSS